MISSPDNTLQVNVKTRMGWRKNQERQGQDALYTYSDIRHVKLYIVATTTCRQSW